MTFRPEGRVPFVEQVFEQSKAQIRAFPGCRHMELLRATADTDTLFTLSYWDSAAHLEQYRQSALFQDTWAKTKALFAQKAESWSTEMIDSP